MHKLLSSVLVLIIVCTFETDYVHRRILRSNERYYTWVHCTQPTPPSFAQETPKKTLMIRAIDLAANSGPFFVLKPSPIDSGMNNVNRVMKMKSWHCLQ
ncbi:hypothetical protein EPI10_031240 [Gossypium australe]|uniref:Uncharacterized protein n=1 Tax=Gossypium australe TaxID=47621 RepID=A0A5B6X2W1_9ROSI|nr:hypothetical protein EPI10_031240 [Gossypium australe]